MNLQQEDINAMEPQAELIRLFMFTENELNQNRQGELSSRQLEHATEQPLQFVYLGIGVMVVWLTVTVWVMSILPIAGWILLPLGVILLVVIIYWYLRVRAAVQQPIPIQQVSGTLQRERNITGGGLWGWLQRVVRVNRTAYYMVVDGERFSISEMAFQLLARNGYYSIYYLDLNYAKRVLSAEWHSQP